MIRTAGLWLGLCVLLSVPVLAVQADLRYVDSILDLTTTYRPQAVLASPRPIDGLEARTYEGTPLYATIPLNGEVFPVVLDRTSDGAVLYTAPDGGGSLRRVDWDPLTTSGIRSASVAFQVAYGKKSTVEPYRVRLLWDPRTPVVIVYFRDSYRTGTIALGDTSYPIALVDGNSDGRYDDLAGDVLYIDVDRDGRFLTTSDSHERYLAAEPFNIAGTVYRVTQVTPDGSRLTVGRSDAQVAEKPPLEVGHKAPGFTARDEAGRTIDLSSLAGKVVVLDFWASWCEPCRVLLPTVGAIHDDLGARGVAVIGINVDRDKGLFQQAVADLGLSYPQIYDGLDGPVSSLYRVSALPTTYVIDQTGTIRAKDLRGEALRRAVDALLNPRE